MKKVLFMIHDLGPGGAEKVLVNLVNNMDPEKFDVTVLSLFDVGIHRKNLKKHIHYKYAFKRMIPGNSHFMKILPPSILHRFIVKDKYDIEIAYLEGPCARIISGCEDPQVKKIAWIHRTVDTDELYTLGFRNKKEANNSYGKFDRIICVSRDIEKSFCSFYLKKNTEVLYNTNDSAKIIDLAEEKLNTEFSVRPRMITVGTLKKIKGLDRLLNIALRLKQDGVVFSLIIVGGGPLYDSIYSFIQKNKLEDIVILTGNQTNPYKYVKNCDLYVCSSYSEGFSTAATEALILGIPVCTVDVSGMREMLGEKNEYGVVTDNSEEALYHQIKDFLLNPELLAVYKRKAEERGESFSTSRTVRAVEDMLLRE